MGIYAMNDINYDMVGYLWLAGNLVATVFNTFWNSVFVKEFKKRNTQVKFKLHMCHVLISSLHADSRGH
jgi:hypothetical protein